LWGIVPLYEYQCKKCHSLTERIQKFSDPPLTVCPHCGGELEQLISAPAVQFKGSGWYVTDYANKSSKGGSSSGNDSPSSSSESKPGSSSDAESKSNSESKSESSSKNTSSSSEKSSSGSDQPAKK
jgi:putative FmdB family regulatory protein